MRLLLGVALAFGLATAATAEPAGQDQVSNSFANPPAASGSLFADPATPAESQANLRESYDLSVMMLKKKMERLTKEDGGQLSEAHQLSLQRELDDVNRRYHAGRYARR